MKDTQIHVVKSLIYTIVVAIIVGISVFKITNRFARHSSYTTELVRATVNLAALNHLRLGEHNEAIKILEHDLYSNQQVLDVDSSGISNKLYTNMQSRLREIKLYQASNKAKKK